jgi:hypothetical protein
LEEPFFQFGEILWSTRKSLRGREKRIAGAIARAFVTQLEIAKEKLLTTEHFPKSIDIEKVSFEVCKDKIQLLALACSILA